MCKSIWHCLLAEEEAIRERERGDGNGIPMRDRVHQTGVQMGVHNPAFTITSEHGCPDAPRSFYNSIAPPSYESVCGRPSTPPPAYKDLFPT